MQEVNLEINKKSDSEPSFKDIAESIGHVNQKSTIQELPLVNSQIDLSCTGNQLSKVFEDDPQITGAILTEQDEFRGMISRRRFFEKMSQPYSLTLYSNRPLSYLYSLIENELTNVLVLPSNTLITIAADRCLQRPKSLINEPVVVEITKNDYRLLDTHLLSIARAKIHNLEKELLEEAYQEVTILKERLESENFRMSAELNVTRRLQQMLLPKPEELSQIPELEIDGYMMPSDEVGGDYYDVLTYNNRVKIGIGDVTGHGLESGVLMIMVQTAVRTLLVNNEPDQTKFLSTLNQVIYDNAQRINSDKNMSLSLLEYEEGKLYLSGQHEEVVIVRANGEVERIDTIDLGLPIGLDENIEPFLAQKEIQLYTGDVVVLYTDGITEAENIEGEQYGLERMCEVVKFNCHASASNIKQIVIDDVNRHIGDQKVFDDITLVIMKKK